MSNRESPSPQDRENRSGKPARPVLAAPPVETAAAAAAPGETLDRANLGRYRFIRRLGKGGMGSVYLAEDSNLKRQVALKIPEFHGDDSGDLVARFYREARAAATIHHSHLCPVYDVGQIDGTHYLTMAYIEGEPLSARVRQPERPFSVADAATLVRKLVLAIHEAHLKGVVHRDLKPSNIMLTSQGEPVIVDFGLARRADCDDLTLTRLGTLMGTPGYMSPEQVEGDMEQIGPLTDLYSLGVVLYELLTGRLPFQGSVASVLGQIARDAPPPPSNFRSGLDARIESICLKMIARLPADRYAGGPEAAAALEAYLKTVASSPEPLLEPLRSVARTIAPPASGQETYAVSQPPVATRHSGPVPASHAASEATDDFRERVEALLVEGRFPEALLALEAVPTTSLPRESCLKQFVAALQGALQQHIQSKRLKRAVRVASSFHAAELSEESPEILARTLSGVARAVWNDDDPGPALQIWQGAIDRFSDTPLLNLKAAIFAANRAVALEQSGNLGLAVALYRQSLAYDPTPEPVRKRFAIACRNRAAKESAAGNFDQVIKICDEGLRVLPGNRSLLAFRQQALNKIEEGGP